MDNLSIFEPFLTTLKDILSDGLYEELEELFIDCAEENNRYYMLQGMSIAMERRHV